MMRMKVRGTFLMLFLAFPITQVWANECESAVDLFRNAGASSQFFGGSYGYAIFPSIGKAGFVVGGAYGKGCVYEQGAHVGDSSVTQLSVGFQAGGIGYSQIIFFQDKRSFADFTSDNFEFSAGAQATAITASASATTSSTGNSAGVSGGKKDATTVGSKYNKGMATFTIAKGGLMAEASLAGQKYKYTAK